MTLPETEKATPELTAAWLEYHAILEEVRHKMEATARFRDTPQHRAKAYHTLMEMQAMAYTFAVARTDGGYFIVPGADVERAVR